MISKKEAFKILEEEGIDGKVLKHSLKVNQISMFLGEKIKSRGENVDLELLDIASLLHDVGRKLSDENGKNHVENGVGILKKRGLNKVADVVEKHVLTSVLNENESPKTWEEKILYYSDKRVNEDKLVSIKERLNYYKKRYPGIRKDFEEIALKVKRLEKEILDNAGVDKDFDFKKH